MGPASAAGGPSPLSSSPPASSPAKTFLNAQRYTSLSGERKGTGSNLVASWKPAKDSSILLNCPGLYTLLGVGGVRGYIPSARWVSINDSSNLSISAGFQELDYGGGGGSSGGFPPDHFFLRQPLTLIQLFFVKATIELAGRAATPVRKTFYPAPPSASSVLSFGT